VFIGPDPTRNVKKSTGLKPNENWQDYLDTVNLKKQENGENYVTISFKFVVPSTVLVEWTGLELWQQRQKARTSITTNSVTGCDRQPLGVIVSHWVWSSATGYDRQPLGMIVSHWVWSSATGCDRQPLIQLFIGSAVTLYYKFIK
jgi:hypothetical protein